MGAYCIEIHTPQKIDKVISGLVGLLQELSDKHSSFSVLHIFSKECKIGRKCQWLQKCPPKANSLNVEELLLREVNLVLSQFQKSRHFLMLENYSIKIHKYSLDIGEV